MLKKIISSVALTLIVSANLTALDVCPGEHYFTYYQTNVFNFDDEPSLQKWECLDGNNGVIYWDFQPGVQRFEWWTEHAGYTSCPKGTEHYGDFCLDPKTAKLPKFTYAPNPVEPELGDAGTNAECINSYVIPKTREFHEDIEITGLIETLHYASSRTADYIDGLGDYVVADIANGWTLSNVHHFKAPYLYLGNGSMVKLQASQYTINENNETTLYDENHVGHEFDANGNIIRSFDPITDNTLFSFTYDSEGLLLSVTDRFNLTTTILRRNPGKVYAIMAPHGEVTKLKIDKNNNLLSAKYEDRTSYSFKYDVGALMTLENDPVGNDFLHTFDSFGRVTSVTDAVGATWKYSNTGDSTSGLVTSTDSEGETKEYENFYPANGVQISKSTSPSGDVTTVSTTDDELEVTTTTCDITNKQIYVYDDITSQKRLASNVTTTPNGLTNAMSMQKDYTFDGTSIQSVEDTIKVNSKLSTLITDYTTHTKTITTPENRVVEIEFDPISEQPLSIVQAGIEPILYIYSSEGNLLTQTQAQRTTTYQYDERANITSYTDAMEQTTHYNYDVMNRLISIEYPNGYSTLFEYDANGNMLKLTTPTPTDYSFTYNGVDKRTSLKSPLGNETLYSYDKVRRLTSIQKPSSASIDYTYTDGRLSSIVSPEGTILYYYSCGDLPTQIIMENESIDYSYDGELLTSVDYSGILNESISYTYNNDFLAISITYAGATDNYTYDKDGLLTSSGAFTITRDSANGYATQLSDGNYTQTYSYNDYGELSLEQDNTFAYSLQRDKLGRITQKEETLNNVNTSYEYTYDNRGKLTTVSKNSEVVEEYTYDANSNRVSAVVNGVSTTASYTLDDNLEVYGNNTYLYDVDGNLIEKIIPEGTTTYSYTTKGALKEVVTPTNTIEYILNPYEQRVAKKVDGTITEKYLWKDLTTLLATLDANNNIIQRYNYAHNRMPISMTQNNQTYYLHYDQVGTLRAITDINHNIVKEITYDTYGNIQNDTNPNFKIPFGFAGGLQDQNTQLVHFGYREYDPQTGKWTTKDPIDFNGGDSNLYGYVLQDPVNLVDPEGLTPFTAGAGALVGGFAGGVVGGFGSYMNGGSFWRGASVGAAGGAFAGAMAGIGNMPGASAAWSWVGYAGDMTFNAYNAVDNVCP